MASTLPSASMGSRVGKPTGSTVIAETSRPFAVADKDGCEVVVHAGGQHNFSMPTKAGYDADVAKAARDGVITCFSGM